MAVLCIGLVFAGPVWGYEASGMVGAEHRQWFEPATYPDTRDGQSSLVFDARLRADAWTIAPFVRLDSVDDNRSHWDLREAKWTHAGDGWDLDAGIGIVFWGVTESQHLVDVINQRDAVEDVTGDARLGQPMVHGRRFGDWGALELFVLPYFRERPFREQPSRYRIPMEVDEAHALFESDEKERHVDVAVRATTSSGIWDLGVSLFEGTNREPELVFRPNPDRLLPYYLQMTQWGVDLQATSDRTLYKLEAIHRRTSQAEFTACVAGLEHTYFSAMGQSDLALLLEYNWNDLGDEAATPYQNDLFVGLRFVANDTEGSEGLVGIVADLTRETRFGRLRASRRFGDAYRLSFEAYWFDTADRHDPVYAYRSEDHAVISLNYYF